MAMGSIERSRPHDRSPADRNDRGERRARPADPGRKSAPGLCCALVPARDSKPLSVAATPSGLRRAGRVPWAELLRRVFATDVLSCPCGSRRSVVAVVVDSAIARAVLATLGLPCTPATFAPARDPPQGELWFDDAGSPLTTADTFGRDRSAPTLPACARADTAYIRWRSSAPGSALAWHRGIPGEGHRM